MRSASGIVSLLGLEPHPLEGGYFAETYRAAETLPEEALPDRYGGPRSASTAIYYLLTPGTVSRLHRLRTDEVFHFYLGDPVEMLQLHPDGSGHTLTLGQDITGGMHVQAVIPMGVWQSARLHPRGRFALLGATVAPGFDYADYESGDRAVLQASHPQFADLIAVLTP
jgi:predicted cupin superfamily sugar epimerase